jgi:hypothetical protein
MDNVLLAPHNSNSSPAAWERVHQNTIRNLLLGLGDRLRRVFNRYLKSNKHRVNNMNDQNNFFVALPPTNHTDHRRGWRHWPRHGACVRSLRLARDRRRPGALRRGFPPTACSSRPISRVGENLERSSAGAGLHPHAGCPGQQRCSADRQADYGNQRRRMGRGDGLQPALGLPGGQAGPPAASKQLGAARSSMSPRSMPSRLRPISPPTPPAKAVCWP